MKSYKKFLLESVINKNKKDEIFNYNSIINDKWREIILFSQKFYHISFDLENNESTNEKKVIYVEKDLRINQPVKYKFNCELCLAGGDWQCPVLYFKIQIESGSCYGLVNQKYYANPKYIWDFEKSPVIRDCYVVIPPLDAGNLLKKTETGYCAYNNDESNIKITADNKKQVWNWLIEYLTEAVEKRHTMIK
jgi:hypothetical protein